MDLLCRLHESGRRGEITLPLPSWLSWCGCEQDVFILCITEINVTEVGTILINGGTCPANVSMSLSCVPVLITVQSRRMLREEKMRQYEKLRKRLQRRAAPVSEAVPVDVRGSPPVPSSSSLNPDPEEEKKKNPPTPLMPVDISASRAKSAEAISAGGFTRISEALQMLFRPYAEKPELAERRESG